MSVATAWPTGDEVVLVLKPKGRGNWKPLVLAISGAHLPTLTVKPGDLVPLGGVTFRVCQVLP